MNMSLYDRKIVCFDEHRFSDILEEGKNLWEVTVPSTKAALLCAHLFRTLSEQCPMKL